MVAGTRLSDEELRATVDAYNANGNNKSATASALDIDRKTLRDRLAAASRRGLMGFKPVLEGFEVTRTTDVQDANGESVRRYIEQRPEHGADFAMPAGHVVKGVSALLDPNGREIIKWVKTKEGELDPLAIAGWLKEAFTDYAPAAPVTPAPDHASDDLLTLFPLADWHLGMHAWHREVGANWDLKIAERAIGEAMDDCISRSPPSGTAIVLGGGDLAHYDNKRVETANGTRQDGDGRYQKIVLVAGHLVVRTVEAAARRHARVIVRILPGNHDEHASVAIAYFLHAWFRNDPRVTVDIDPSLFWWHRFGNVMLGATHGHTVKVNKMPGIMAARRAEDWGATKFRYVHGFHLHHIEKGGNEENGCVWEIHRAPVPQDAWHFGSGYLSGRSVKAITYHREFGWYGEVGTPMRDGGKP